MGRAARAVSGSGRRGPVRGTLGQVAVTLGYVATLTTSPGWGAVGWLAALAWGLRDVGRRGRCDRTARVACVLTSALLATWIGVMASTRFTPADAAAQRVDAGWPLPLIRAVVEPRTATDGTATGDPITGNGRSWGSLDVADAAGFSANLGLFALVSWFALRAVPDRLLARAVRPLLVVTAAAGLVGAEWIARFGAA